MASFEITKQDKTYVTFQHLSIPAKTPMAHTSPSPG